MVHVNIFLHQWKIILNHIILSQQSCPHTHEQNDITEKKHRHIIDTTRPLLISALVPRYLSVEPLFTVVLHINYQSIFLVR